MSLRIVRMLIENRYKKSRKDFTFTISQVAGKLGVASYEVRAPVLNLEKEGSVERVGVSKRGIRWRTRFSRHNRIARWWNRKGRDERERIFASVSLHHDVKLVADPGTVFEDLPELEKNLVIGYFEKIN